MRRRRRIGLGAALAAACACLGAPLWPAPAAAETAAGVAQELTLDGTGVGSETVLAPRGAIEVSFPPPATSVAATGSFVRVFFSHSPEVADGSAMLLALNGQPLTSVPLSPGTAAGGVMEEALPVSQLDQRQANRLQVSFDLRPLPGAAGGLLFGRVDGPTMMHYALSGPAGAAPGLDLYPYSLLPTGVSDPMLGVLLPSAPAPDAAAAALRVLADLGRRAASQRVRPRVVLSDQQAWLAGDGAGTGAVLVGRLDALPTAPPVLEAAGWRRTAAGWSAPDGRVPKADDGLVLTARSPWDHRTPLLLVTGGTAAGVDKAASALAGDGAPPAGGFAIVSDAVSAAREPLTGRSITLDLLGLRDPAAGGPARYLAAAGFAAPAVDPSDTVGLTLTVPATATGAPGGSVELDVNGTRVAAGALEGGGVRPGQLRASFLGRLLRPGGNSISVDLRVEGSAPAGGPPPGPPVFGIGDPLTATISLPSSEPAVPDLRLLPWPFLEGERQADVVLADRSAETLTAAAQAMLALGRRSTAPPPPVRAGFADWGGSGDANLIVVGALPSGAPLAATAQQRPVAFGPSGQVTLIGQHPGERLRLTSSIGAIQEVRTPDTAPRQVLWLDGTGPDMLAGAAAAIYDDRLGGQAALVDAAGRLSSLNPTGTAGGGPGLGTAQIAAVVAAGLLVAVMVLQLVRPRRPSR